MKKITVMSEYEAKYFAKQTKEKAVLVSIVEKSREPIQFDENENIVDIFRLYLNDICNDIFDKDDSNKMILKAPEQEDFNGLKDFIDKYKDFNIVVHCAAGVSRSAGVAMAIGEYLGIKTGISTSKNYAPNMLCYRFTQYELTKYHLGDGFKKQEIKEES